MGLEIPSSRMKLAHKVALLYTAFPLGGVIAGLMLSDAPASWDSLLMLGLGTWFLAFLVVTFSQLICPHCGASAIFTPEGHHHPFVGNQCRYCNKPY